MCQRKNNLFSLLLLFLCGSTLSDLSAQEYCDSNLLQNVNGPLGYANRGNRCEGIYIKPVGATPLWIASFTESFEDYRLNVSNPLLVEWNKTPANNISRLRVQSVKRRLYYRMDTYLPIGITSFNWANNLLSSLNILKVDIGVVCLTKYAFGKQTEDIYLPVRIRQLGKSIRSKSITLLLMPGVELTEVYSSLAPAAANGNPGKFIIDGKKLGYGYYPADRGIEIPITGLTKEGLYYQEISATLKSGGSSSIKFWFYYSNK
jgi:hypothetical protein